MSEIREPPVLVWWHCHACGQSNGPMDTKFCSFCGRYKQDVIDAERWRKFLTADAVIVDTPPVRCEKCEAIRRGLQYPTDETERLLVDAGYMCHKHLVEAGLPDAHP